MVDMDDGVTGDGDEGVERRQSRTLMMTNNRGAYRRSTSINNFIPPSMDTNLPSLTRYYSLNRTTNNSRNINNLDIVNHNNRNNMYCTMSHRNVRLILPPAQEMIDQVPNHILHQGPNFMGQETNNYEATYNVSSTSDYNTISVSDGSSDNQTLLKHPNSGTQSKLMKLKSTAMNWLQVALFLLTVLSPLIMISVPKMEVVSLKHSQLQCGVGCEGSKISIIFKLILLVLSQWAVLYKSSLSSCQLPKLHLTKTCLLLSLLLLLSLYWSFYMIKFTQSNISNLLYEDIVDFVSNYVTTVLYLHYLTVLIIIIRPNVASQYVIHIVRGEDGASSYVQVGNLLLQEAAGEVLTSYYQQYSEPVGGTKKQSSSKHKTQLLTATEESFGRISTVVGDKDASENHHDIASAVFPVIYKHLLKYLKSVQQSKHHTMDRIMENLATYIKFGMSPQSFLSTYLTTPSVIQKVDIGVSENWTLQCDEPSLYKPVMNGMRFQLKHEASSTILYCEVKMMPTMEIYTQKYAEVIAGHFSWEGDRESPV